MKVKVTNGDFWYKDKIGEVFEVTEHSKYYDGELWKVVDPVNSIETGLYKKDCEEVKEMPKFNIGSKVIIRDGSEDDGRTAVIIGTGSFFPWRIKYDNDNFDDPTELFNESQLELVDNQWMDKATALKLCIDGAKIVPEEASHPQTHMYFNGNNFMYYGGISRTHKVATYHFEPTKWKLWQPPTPPKPKFAVDELCLDQDLFYAVVVSMEHDGKQWKYTVSNSTKDNGEEFYEYLSESELTKV